MAIRFVPMTEEEAAALQADEARRDTKRIYATDDMHNRYCAPLFGDDIKEWHPLVDQYVGSDVEWIAMEQVRTFITGYLPGGDPDRFLFQRACDKRVQEQFDREKNDRILKEMTAYSKKKGFKTCLSLRMGAWGMVYPYDQYYFEVPFCRENPHLHCLDRNGNDMNAMSYAFPEVQDFMIGELVNMAKMGPDAVSLIATRGLPYVLFEKPVADRFYEKYGEYPYELPVDEPRLNGIHCEIMLEFMRRVRRSLDEAAGKGRVKIHMFVMASPFDNKMIGLNVEAMMAEGLLDAVVVDSCRFREILPPSVFRETGDRWRIDLTKYEDYVWHQKSQAAVREYFQKENYRGPYENYNGEICGPRDAKEWMDQWNGLEKKYGASVYFNLMPRILPNEEFQRRAAELYGLGAERLCLWDSYLRADYPEMWQTIAKKLGHKDELFEMDLTDPYRRSYQLKKLDGKDFTRYHPNWGG